MKIAISGARLAAAATLIALPVSAHAAVMLTGPTYTENFNSLIVSGSANAPGGVLPNGWQFVESGGGGAVNTTYRAGTGSDNAGDTWSFGASGNSDRALGALASGSLESTFGVIFTNNTGSTITSLDVNFFNEQWRNGSTTTLSSFDFSFLVGATSLGGSGWTGLAALDLIDLIATGSPNGAAVNGNVTRLLRTGSITGLNLAQGQSIGFRWIDIDDVGSDDALAIDDFALTANFADVPAIPEPATWAMMIGGFALVGGALRRRDRGVVIA